MVSGIRRLDILVWLEPEDSPNINPKRERGPFCTPPSLGRLRVSMPRRIGLIDRQNACPLVTGRMPVLLIERQSTLGAGGFQSPLGPS